MGSGRGWCEGGRGRKGRRVEGLSNECCGGRRRTSMPIESSFCFREDFVVGDFGSVVWEMVEVSPWAVVGDVGAPEAEAALFRGIVACVGDCRRR